MIYGSVCSGIEAATAAWHPLGWRPAFFAEIEAFPSAVLKHHYPDVRNVGDFTRLIDAAAPVPAIDVLVGGTPCQSFSVAGLRRGLADARGGLTLEFVRLAQRLKPRWIVWENVPGVLSQDGGRAFGAFLGALGELGYGWAYRVLDAQYFGVAQRRRRVFVVAHSGGRAERAASVLFEPEGVRRHTPPSREAGQRAAPTLAARTRGGGGLGTDFDLDGGLIRHDGGRGVATQADVVAPPLCMAHGQGGAEIRVDGAPSLTCNHEAPIVFSDSGLNGQDAHSGRILPVTYAAPTRAFYSSNGVVHELDGVMATLDAARESRGTNQQRFLMQPTTYAAPAIGAFVPSEVAGTLMKHNGAGPGETQNAYTGRVLPVVQCVTGERTHALKAEGADASEDGTGRGNPIVNAGMSVRRLTPTECERLQGFPDDYTRIPWKTKPASECPDGPRYKALGNSMAVPVMRWIGERIAKVEAV